MNFLSDNTVSQLSNAALRTCNLVASSSLFLILSPCLVSVYTEHNRGAEQVPLLVADRTADLQNNEITYLSCVGGAD